MRKPLLLAVDGAKAFHESLGWRLDADVAGENDFRVVQLTPPGSTCSIIFGSKVTSAAPGAADVQIAVHARDEHGMDEGPRLRSAILTGALTIGPIPAESGFTDCFLMGA